MSAGFRDASTAAAIGKGGADARERYPEGRRQAEEHPGQHRYAGGEQQHSRVHPNVFRARQTAGQQLERRLRSPIRQGQTERATNEREDEALRQKLPHQSSTTCAKGHAYADLMLTAAGARQQKVRDIAAGDQQHHRHGPQQDQ